MILSHAISQLQWGFSSPLVICPSPAQPKEQAQELSSVWVGDEELLIHYAQHWRHHPRRCQARLKLLRVLVMALMRMRLDC